MGKSEFTKEYFDENIVLFIDRPILYRIYDIQ
jgi:hypothetical protein